ncbi:MAG: hypothetical protein NC300_12010 [Bacteroidales bacterium]|nr:hypothetical protein [Clostridium sp.]MCM1204856.1 hypothetical protein [Bacteroidales bacterium]
MKDYKALAVRYLKLNKKRSIITIAGVSVAAMVLFVLLNLICSSILKVREEIRETADYEIILCTETESQIKQIMEDDRVKSAAVGPYHYWEIGADEPELYEHAVFINTSNPYRMDSLLAEFCSTYEIKGELNYNLAITYMQGDTGNLLVIAFLAALLISFIFAIFGVGIVRNSIQLSILEQIKDYGNLRCIGASKGQLKTVVYLEGAIIEITGILIGVSLGTVASAVIGYFIHVDAGFHFLPLVPLLIAFLGDLYFAMEENCKVIIQMTPVSAIRGEFRIRKEKIKMRKQSIFGRMFGIEGDYAYKSIMRNPGRFHKTVWALAIGIAAFIAAAGVTTSVNQYIKEEAERYQYYQFYFECMLGAGKTAEEVKGELPSVENMENVSNLPEVTEAKRIYASTLYVADIEAYWAKYRSDYLENTAVGNSNKTVYERYKEKEEDDFVISWLSMVNGIACYGYDEEDYQRYQPVLVDGTLDVSEHGLVLVNGGNVMKAQSDSLEEEYMDIVFTDYQVGDTIDIVDMKKFNTLFEEKVGKLKEEYDKKREQLPQVSRDSEEYAKVEAEKDAIERDYNSGRNMAVEECYIELMENGDYTTYTIEGIVSEDVNHYYWGEDMHFVLPMKQYMEITGTDESMIAGMQYHFDKYPRNHKMALLLAFEQDWMMDGYIMMMEGLVSVKNGILFVMLFVVFIVLMTTFNIINTAASNLHLRKKELAQLRVLGISKKGLMKIVMLEGVIEAIVANLLGMLLGVAISYGCYQILMALNGMKYYFPVAAVIFSILLSLIILCGSIYVPLKGMKQDVAEDLATGGD